MGRGEYRNDRSKTNSVVITHENPPVELRNIFFCFLSFTSDRSDWKYYSVRMYRVRKIGRISLGPMLRFHWNFRGIRFFPLENFIEGSTGIGEQRWIYGIVMAAQVRFISIYFRLFRALMDWCVVFSFFHTYEVKQFNCWHFLFPWY